MRSIKWTLCVAAITAAISLSSKSFAQEEPIPDFGPSGPAGIEKRGLKGGGPPAKAENPQGRPIDQRRRMQLQMPNIRQALQRMDLSDEQREEIRSVFARYAEEGKAIREDRLTAQQSLKAAQEANPVDKAAVKSARDAIAAITKQSGSLQAEVRTTVLNVLTFEQEENLYRRVEIMRKRDENQNSEKAKP